MAARRARSRARGARSEVADELLRGGAADERRAERPWSGRRLHFVGVGGAGMSALRARRARARRARSRGSDARRRPYLERLRADGVLEAAIGHAPRTCPRGEDVELVYSSGDPGREPRARRRARARPRRAPARGAARRADAPAADDRGRRHARQDDDRGDARARPARRRPRPGLARSAARRRRARQRALERAASGSSSRPTSPIARCSASSVEIAVLTNVELDHHATYGSLAELREAFRAFLAGAARGGRSGTGRSCSRCARRRRCVALRRAARSTLDARAARAFAGAGARSRWRCPAPTTRCNAAGGARGRAARRRRRAAPAIAGLAGFTRRRAALSARSARSAGGAQVYDDYAHHPTEVAATLRGARTLAHRRLVAVFQPHLYSRTALLAREFGARAGARRRGRRARRLRRRASAPRTIPG